MEPTDTFSKGTSHRLKKVLYKSSREIDIDRKVGLPLEAWCQQKSGIPKSMLSTGALQREEIHF